MAEKNNNLEEITKEIYLDKRLEEYAKSDYYPFHMPGHKRQLADDMFPSRIDITEIDGFDNLHDAREIIEAAQRRAGALYGAAHTSFLVNGSTCGLLAAVSAAVPRGGKILIARNCHRAVYHAAYLRQLSVEYVFPEIRAEGIQGAIEPEAVREALDLNKEIGAVVITSPTYDGIVSDISTIADIVHAHGIPLIVDEAHGAHFGFHPYFPQTAVRLGADVVVQSMHKTLPSLTQTALLHVQSGRVAQEKIQRFLDIYETSSPSYVLMAGMERCVRMIEKRGEKLFEAYAGQLRRFYQETSGLKNIRVLPESKDRDPSKLLIFGDKLGLDGKALYEILLKKYHLQPEMCTGSYVLAMTSFADTEEGFERLLAALRDIEGTYDGGSQGHQEHTGDFIKRIYQRTEKCLEPYQAWDREAVELPLGKAAGRISAEFVNLYPPGIPLLVPGEEISEEMTGNIQECISRGLCVQGVDKCAQDGNLWIKVVN